MIGQNIYIVGAQTHPVRGQTLGIPQAVGGSPPPLCLLWFLNVFDGPVLFLTDLRRFRYGARLSVCPSRGWFSSNSGRRGSHGVPDVCQSPISMY